MFYEPRFQTGELDDVVKEMMKNNIPSVDVSDDNEFKWVLEQLEKRGIYRLQNIPLDKGARDKEKYPEFEFRLAFGNNNGNHETPVIYIDFFFESEDEETYDPIFGD